VTHHYTRKTAPTVDPVDLAQAKLQCRIGYRVSDEDALVTAYIKAAASWVEGYTGRALMAQTWQASVPEGPERWWLPYGAPNAAVSFVKYYDTSNTLQTLSSSQYLLAAFSEPACLSLKDGETWPTLFDRDDAVQVEYTVGATDPADVPMPLVQAVLLHTQLHYERLALTPAEIKAMWDSIEALCAPHRLFLRSPEW
jgi:uncharacterized phiE125 gp8 family phage protein